MNLDLNREALQRAAERAAGLFTEIYTKLENRRVYPTATHGSLAAMFADSLSNEGVGLEQVLEEFEQQILPNSMGTPHPLYLGLVNSSPLPAGPLADLLVSSLNNNSGSFHQSPAISTLEQEVVKAFGNLCGLPKEATGMILPGGTFANLQGLMLARRRHFPEWFLDGPRALTGNPILYASDVTHFCNQRAASVIGLGEKGVVSIRSRDRGAIDTAALEAQIIGDREAGHLPFAVVANAGTTGTGAIDPISLLAEICQRHELWLHVDACYGGGALLARPVIPELAGIHRADSIAIDPHKWFFVPMTAGLLLTRHPDLELETFDAATSYIPGDGTVDAFRRGMPTSRRGSGLTIWMVLRAHGWRVIREAIERNMQLTRRLESRLHDYGFRVLNGGQLSVACARWEPRDASPTVLDDLQISIAQTVIASGKSWFSTVKHDGRIWLRLNLVNYHTREHHIDQLAELIKQAADDCSLSN